MKIDCLYNNQSVEEEHYEFYARQIHYFPKCSCVIERSWLTLIKSLKILNFRELVKYNHLKTIYLIV